MNDNLQRCVIDNEGMYVDYVIVDVDESPINYKLKKGEKLIKTSPPLEFYLKNKWTGSGWLLEATEEEREQAEYEAEQARKDYYASIGVVYPFEPQEQPSNTLEIQSQAMDELIMMVFDLQSKVDELEAQQVNPL